MKDFVSIDRLLKERGISSEEMKTAADLTVEKLSPEPENGSQETLSQERRERILDQIEAGNAPKRRRNPLRVAGVAAALLAVSFLLVLYGPRAMASIRTWIKKAYGKTVEYEFLGEPEEKLRELPGCDFGWLPEGYEMVDYIHGEPFNEVMYVFQKDEDMFFVDYSPMEQGSGLIVSFSERETVEEFSTMVGNKDAVFYLSTEGEYDNVLIWMDEELKLSYSVQGRIDMETMILIAENMHLQ